MGAGSHLSGVLSKTSGARVMRVRRASDYIRLQTDGHTADAVGPGNTSQRNTITEMIMRAISSAASAPRGMAVQAWISRLVVTLERWLVAYMNWRIEQAAIAQLWSMSDRELKDIGLTRSEIIGAVRGETGCDRGFGRYY
jgi:uncharacterized protein YjiS (DUF1127 family)